MSERVGFLTVGQQKFIDEIIVLKGIGEAVDGLAIRLADDIGLEKLKQALIEKNPNLEMSMIYEIVDAILIGVGYDPAKYEEGEE